MRSLVVKKFWNRFLYSKIIFVFFVILSFWVWYKVYFIFIKYIELRDSNSFLSEKGQTLEKTHNDVITKLQFLETERGKEETLKKEYNLSKNNEKEIIMHKSPTSKDILQEVDNMQYTDNVNIGVWDYVKYFIKNYTNIDWK